MMMVSCMYHGGAFVTNAENYAKHGFHRDVQSIIEKWYVYILARCPSEDHQLLYTQERISDVLELDCKITHNGISITDVMQIFKGDNLAAQFQSGLQENGDYFCWQCPLFAPLSPNIVHTLPNLPFSDRISKVRSRFQWSIYFKITGKLCQAIQKPKKKDQLVQELHERKLSFTCMSSTKDLHMLLYKEMHQIQRLPALLFQNPGKNLKELYLSDYEVLNNEPLHDVSHHIEHLYEELPHHTPKDFKKSLKEII